MLPSRTQWVNRCDSKTSSILSFSLSMVENIKTKLSKFEIEICFKHNGIKVYNHFLSICYYDRKIKFLKFNDIFKTPETLTTVRTSDISSFLVTMIRKYLSLSIETTSILNEGYSLPC